MRMIVFLATYPPEKCGIGTFTFNLRNAIQQVTEGDEYYSTSVVAISANPSDHDYPEEVKFTIDKNNLKDYEEAADFINRTADICFIQHEFGIFGGETGIFLLSLLGKIKIPIVVTFHTVLNNPTKSQKSILSAVAKRASKVFVMSYLAVDFLEHIYKVSSDKIVKIDHGVPVFNLPSREKLRKHKKFDGKRVLLTFGLLSRNKGLEVVINALPAVVKKFPDVSYIVLGKTHPNVVKESGEEYRKYLKLLARKLGVEKNVVFDDRYVSDRELMEMLSACDVYITPYLNEEQITSGTLSYAVGVGALIVSTPYWHAKELLSDNRGVLFPFNDSQRLSEELITLFEKPELAEEIRDTAATYGMQLGWPKIAHKYLANLDLVEDKDVASYADHSLHVDLAVLPKFNFEHLQKFTNETGILQHAKYDIPNLKEGYCIDDNSRALIMLLMARKYIKDKELQELMVRYMSFIHYMQKTDGSFHNMLKYDLKHMPEKDSEDAYGRTLWALGKMASVNLSAQELKGLRKLACELFDKALPFVDKLVSLRGKANALIGLCVYSAQNSKKYNKVSSRIRKIADELTDVFNSNSSVKWQWFEDIVTYDNGIMPLSLLYAFDAAKDHKYMEIAKKALLFLDKHTLVNNIFVPVGNDGWFKKNGNKPEYDQQPLEAMSMIMAYQMLYKITGNKDYLNNLFKIFLWFLGHNTKYESLYVPTTGACYDGVTKDGANENQGAESTLAYWISYFTVLDAYFYQFE